MRKVRILIFDDSSSIGGQHLGLRDIYQRLDKIRFDVMAGHLGNDLIRDSFQSVGVRCICLGPAGPFKRLANVPKNLGSLARLVSVIRREQVDVIETNGSVSHFLGSLAVPLTGVRQVRIPGGLLSTAEPLHYRLFPLLRLDRFTSAYICALPAMKRELMGLGVPEEKTKLVFWWVDTHRFHPGIESNLTRRELGAGEGDTLIGIASRLVEDRGFEPLMRAVARLVQNGRKGVKVAFVGDGPRREEFEALSRSLGLDRHVRFASLRHDMPQVINALNIAVLVSRDPYGSSFLREAMACGKPIITTDGPSRAQRDWIDHGKTGLLVQPDDIEGNLEQALTYLLDNPSIAQEIGRNARAYVEQHLSLEKSMRQLEEVFIDACAE